MEEEKDGREGGRVQEAEKSLSGRKRAESLKKQRQTALLDYVAREISGHQDTKVSASGKNREDFLGEGNSELVKLSDWFAHNRLTKVQQEHKAGVGAPLLQPTTGRCNKCIRTEKALHSQPLAGTTVYF